MYLYGNHFFRPECLRRGKLRKWDMVNNIGHRFDTADDFATDSGRLFLLLLLFWETAVLLEYGFLDMECRLCFHLPAQ